MRQRYRMRRNVRTKLVTAAVVAVGWPAFLLGYDFLLHEWFYGCGPRWWHRLRGDEPLSRRDHPLVCRVCGDPIPPDERAWFVKDDGTGLHAACDQSLLKGTR